MSERSTSTPRSDCSRRNGRPRTAAVGALRAGGSADLGDVVERVPGTGVLYEGRVTHRRLEPVRNDFSYRCYMWLVDIDRLPRLPWYLRPLARFEARDHLGDPDRSIRENVDAFLARHDIDLDGGRVLMLANARVAGYVFNPLSVFWCLDAAGQLAAVLAEVHNTYGERHVYPLRLDAQGRATAAKELYVSPFFDTEGRYLMRFSPPGRRLSITMLLERHGSRPFSASLHGERRPATMRNVLGAALRHPLMPLRVSALIRYQGLKLWLRRLPVVPRPRHDATAFPSHAGRAKPLPRWRSLARIVGRVPR